MRSHFVPWLVQARQESFLISNFQLMIELAAKPVRTATPPARSIRVKIISPLLSRCIAPRAINSTCNASPFEIYCVNFTHNFNILLEVQGVRRIGSLLHSSRLDVISPGRNESHNDTITLTFTDTVHLVFIAPGFAALPPSAESCNSPLLKIWIKLGRIRLCACNNMSWNVCFIHFYGVLYNRSLD